MRLLAVLFVLALACAAAGETVARVIFCNLVPGQYVGTCNGVPVQCDVVDESGVLGVACELVAIGDRVHVARITGGVSFSCEAIDE